MHNRQNLSSVLCLHPTLNFIIMQTIQVSFRSKLGLCGKWKMHFMKYFEAQKLFYKTAMILYDLNFSTGKSSVCHTRSHCYLFSWWYIYWVDNTASTKLPTGLNNSWEWKEGWCGCSAVAKLDATIKHIPHSPGKYLCKALGFENFGQSDTKKWKNLSSVIIEYIDA